MLRISIITFLAAITMAATNIYKGYEVGDVVASFELPSVQGEKVSLDDFKSEKGVILVFDCNTCPYSQAYRDRIKDLHSQYADKGFPVVAVNPNDPVKQPGDSFEAMKEYAKKYNYAHYYLQDTEQTVTRAFGATNTPHVFVLENTDGGFKVAYIGAIDNNTKSADDADKVYVQDAVNAIIAGKDVPVTKTKAIGCSIKWKAS